MSLKIYFCGSIQGGRQDRELYERIIGILKTYGTVLTEHVGKKDDDLQKCESKLTSKEIHDRDMEWMQESDVIVAEVTQPSLGVGYEIGRAVTMEKKILVLYRPSPTTRLSAMIGGIANDDDRIVKHYKETEVEGILQNYFKLNFDL